MNILSILYYAKKFLPKGLYHTLHCQLSLLEECCLLLSHLLGPSFRNDLNPKMPAINIDL